MTAPSLLDELEGVVRLMEAATPGEWFSQVSDPAEGVDCFWLMSLQASKALTEEVGSVNGSQWDDTQRANAELIASAVNFIRTHHAELADMANELRVARESFKRCDEICKCTAEGWRTAEEDMAKRLEAAERDAFKWQLLCADCDDAGEGNRAAINVVNDACRLGSGALERHYGQAARDGLDAAIAAAQEGAG